MPLDDYTKDAVAYLEKEVVRLRKMSGLDPDSSMAGASKRRRKVIYELKRRIPGIQVTVLRRNGKETWSLKGSVEQEGEAKRVLKELLDSQDEIGRRKDPFQVGDLDKDDLHRRFEERAAMLEPYE